MRRRIRLHGHSVAAFQAKAARQRAARRRLRLEQLERRLLLTVINGDITSDQTWTPNQGPFEVQGHVRLLEGVRLQIAPNTEVKLQGTLEVNGELIANQTDFQFVSLGDLLVRSAPSATEPPSVRIDNSSFAGNPNGSGDFFMVHEGGAVEVTSSVFDEHIDLWNQSMGMVLDDNSFGGSGPLRVLPGQVPDLYDNLFTSQDPVWIDVEGDLQQDAVWQPFSGVVGYRVVGNRVTVGDGFRLTVEAGTRLDVESTLFVEGDLIVNDAEILFTSLGDIRVEGRQSYDPKGHFEATGTKFVGNPARQDDQVIFEQNSTGVITESLFDANSSLISETRGLSLQRNTWQAAEPLVVLPDQIADLYDNAFVSPADVWLSVTGRLESDVQWQPFSGVVGYRVVGNRVTVGDGFRLTVEAGTRLDVESTLFVEGDLIVNDAEILFTSLGDIRVEGRQSYDPKGHFEATGTKFVGNPARRDDQVIFEQNSTGVITESLFDANSSLISETRGLSLQRNTWQAAEPLVVLPDQIADLYDNAFVSPADVWLSVTGRLESDVQWQPFSGVVGYRVVGNRVTVGDGFRLTVEAGTRLDVESTLFVEGDLIVNDAEILFTSLGDIRVEGRQSYDPKGHFEATGTKFVGNPARRDDQVFFEENSTGVIRQSLFDIASDLYSESGGLVLDGNDFQGVSQARLHPDAISDLYDNVFTADRPSYVRTGGTVASDATWLTLENLAGYEIVSRLIVADDVRLEISSGTELIVRDQLDIFGHVVSSGGVISFPGFSDITVEGAATSGEGGRLELSESRLIGNPDRTDDSVIFEANASGLIHNADFGIDTSLWLSPDANVSFSGEQAFGAVELALGGNPDLVVDLGPAYWGTWALDTSESQQAAIEAQLLHRPDDNQRGTIQYEPWLTSSPRGGFGLVGVLPAEPVAGRLDYVDVKFTHPLRRSTVLPEHFTITAPGGARNVEIQDVELLTASTVRVSFEPEVATASNVGVFNLRVSPGLQDLSGTPLDGDGDGIPNEPNDGLSATFELARVVPLPSNVVATGNWTAGESLEVQWTTTNASNLELRGGWTDFVYLSADSELGEDDLLLSSVHHPLHLTSGDSVETALRVVLPGVLPRSYRILVSSVPTGDVRGASDPIAASRSTALSVPALSSPDGAASGILAEPEDADFHRIIVPSGRRLELSGAALGGDAQALVAAGRIPFRDPSDESDADFDFATPGMVSEFALVGPVATESTTYYVRVEKAAAADSVEYALDSTVVDVPPTVVSVTAGGESLASINHWLVTFDRPMNPTTFSVADDVSAATGPGGDLDLVAEWLEPQQLSLRFDARNAPGQYTLSLRPSIADGNGWELDADGDLVAGEVPDDYVVTHFALAFSGDITRDATIPAGTVFVVEDDLTIAADATLTIGAGAVIKFEPQAALYVQGTLRVEGTPGAPVRMTSVYDQSVASGAGDASGQPQAGDWRGIVATSEDAVIELNHAQVHYASTAVNADIANLGLVQLSNVDLRYGDYGVYVYSPFVDLRINNAVIADFQRMGVFVRADSRAEINNATIVNNRIGLHHGAAHVTLLNSIIAHNQEAGWDHNGDQPEVFIARSIFHQPGSENIRWARSVPPPPDLTLAGNLVADPILVNVSAGDFRLGANSPAIDSAASYFSNPIWQTGLDQPNLTAPATDLQGRNRYDDAGAANAGQGDPVYMDRGALERIIDSPKRDFEMSGLEIVGDSQVAAGSPLTVRWRVTNAGDLDIGPNWTLAFHVDGNGQVPRSVPWHVIAMNQIVIAGQTLTGEFTLDLPLSAAGPLRLVSVVNPERQSGESDYQNNVRVADGLVEVQVPTLELGVPVQGNIDAYQWKYYRANVAAADAVLGQLNTSAGGIEIYASRGVAPTILHHDARGEEADVGMREVRLLDHSAGDIYVGIRSSRPTSADFTLLVDVPAVGIRDVRPDTIGSVGTSTLRILGDSFPASAGVELRFGEQTIPATVTRVDASTLLAEVQLSDGTTEGAWDVVVTSDGESMVTLPGALSITAGGQASFRAELELPGLARPGRVVTVRVAFENTGLSDIPSPLLRFRASDEETQWRAPGSEQWISGETFQVLAAGDEALPTVLPAGYRGEALIQVRLPFEREHLEVDLDWYGGQPGGSSAMLLDWEAVIASYPNPEARDGDWELLQEQVGETWWHFAEAIRVNHTRLRGLGNASTSVPEIFDDLFDQALGLGDGEISGRLIDASSGEPLGGIELILGSVNEAGIRRIDTTDESGQFRFRRVTNDQYRLFMDDYELAEPQTFTIDADQLRRDLVVRVQALDREPDLPEAVVHTAVRSVMVEGVPHLIVERDGSWFHQRWEANEWTVAQPMNLPIGAVLSDVDFSPSLFGEGQPGLVALSTMGDGNDLEVVSNVARPLPSGEWEWSDSSAYIQSDVAAGRPKIAFTPSGTPVVVYQMFDAGSVDDPDYYFSTEPFVADGFSSFHLADAILFAEALVQNGPLTAGATEFLSRTQTVLNQGGADDCCSNWSSEFSESFDLQETGALGRKVMDFINNLVKFEVSADFEISGAASMQEVTASGGGAAELRIGDDRRIGGNLGLEAKWKLDRTKCTFVSDTITVAGGFGGEVSVPLFTAWLPFIGGFDVSAGIGVDLQGSYTYPPQAGVSSKLTGITTISPQTSLAIGDGFIAAELTVGGKLTLPTDLLPKVDFGAPSGGIFVDIDFGYYSYSWSYTTEFLGSPAGRLGDTGGNDLLDFRRLGTERPEFTLSLVTPQGSPAVHGSHAIESDVATNLELEHGATVVTGNDGRVYAFWQQETKTPEVNLGSRVVWSVWDGTDWSEPTAIAGSDGFGGQVEAVALPSGSLMVAWPQGDAAGFDLESDPQTVQEAQAQSDLYYSVITPTGEVSKAELLQALAGSAEDAQLLVDAAGTVIATWVERPAGGSVEDWLVASHWTGSGWSDPATLDEGVLATAPAIYLRDGQPTIAWVQETELTEGDSQLVEAIWNGAGWGFPGVIETASASDTQTPQGFGHASYDSADDAFADGSQDRGAQSASQKREISPGEIMPHAADNGPGGSALLGLLTALKRLTLGPPAECCEPEEEVEECDDLLEACGVEDPPTPGGPAGSGETGQSGVIPIRVSATPEDKFGPAGFDPPETPEAERKRFIRGDETLGYRIEIWNKVDALVPTQDAIIVDYLDPSIYDLDSFRFTRAGFLDWDVVLEDPNAELRLRIDPRPDLEFVVDVFGSLDYETGRILWTFQAIDPLTGDYPADPMAGFLPPFNPITRYELGWMEFEADLVAGLADGTTVPNQAFVEFDYLEQFRLCLDAVGLTLEQPGNCIVESGLQDRLIQHPAPKEGPWINTIDRTPPVSSLVPLDAESYANFRVSWTATDAASGPRLFDLYVAVDDGEFAPWLTDVTATSAIFSGEVGREYHFAVVSEDGAGNQESKSLISETSTRTIQGTPFRVESVLPEQSVSDVLTLRFAEPINLSTLIDDGMLGTAVFLKDESGETISLAPDKFQSNEAGDQLELTVGHLPNGIYDLTLNGMLLLDVAGNPLWGPEPDESGEAPEWDGGYIGGQLHHEFLLASDPWTNPTLIWDVNDSEKVTPIDALIVVNFLNRNPDGVLPGPDDRGAPPPYYDVNGSGAVTLLDALQIINYLNRRRLGIEGENDVPAPSRHPGHYPDASRHHAFRAFWEPLGLNDERRREERTTRVNEAEWCRAIDSLFDSDWNSMP